MKNIHKYESMIIPYSFLYVN